MTERIWNYCHDPEIIEAAKRMGFPLNKINEVLSICEGPYASLDTAEALMQEYLDGRKRSRLDRSALSKNQKEKARKIELQRREELQITNLEL